jgi:hypothetical protein
MPFGDGTGPAGMGPMTGRGAGFCAGYPAPGYTNPFVGRARWPRWGAGWFAGGRGRGFRNMYYATGLTGWQRAAAGFPGGFAPVPPFVPWQPSAKQELAALRNELKLMEEGITRTQQRIAELESKEGEEAQ